MYSEMKSKIMLHLVASSLIDPATGVPAYNIGMIDSRADRAAQKLADEGFVEIVIWETPEGRNARRRAILPRDRKTFEAAGYTVSRY